MRRRCGRESIWGELAFFYSVVKEEMRGARQLASGGRRQEAPDHLGNKQAPTPLGLRTSVAVFRRLLLTPTLAFKPSLAILYLDSFLRASSVDRLITG
jgi:hypothetical protein